MIDFKKYMRQNRRVTFDFETRSMCDLKAAGAYKYSLDPTTQPTCLAFKDRDRSTVYFLDFKLINTHWTKLPVEVRDIWSGYIADLYEFSAHNAFFERCIYENILVKRYGWPRIPFRLYRCTAAKAAACALPRGLEGAGEALALNVQKDRRGYNAMMATCKPTKYWNAWNKARLDLKSGKRLSAKRRELALSPEPKVFLDYDDNPVIWNTLYTYCKIDVKAEEAVDNALPDLIPQELEIWQLNQTINWRGFRVDHPTVEKIVTMLEAESKKKLKELDTLTMGLVTKPGARKSILEFLALDGIELPNIQAKTVEDVLKNKFISNDMKRLLEIRQALSKTSTKKYKAFVQRAIDGVVRDILLYCGASTGRDAGTGINPQNFPRGLLKVDNDRPYAHVENVAECEPEMLELLYGESLAVLFSSILRNMIIPDPGHDLFVADFSKIEVVVLWWLAGNEAGLRIIRAGKDPYIYQAAKNLGKSYEEIEKGVAAGETWALDARQLGKAQVLGCGFRMSWKRFQESAHTMYRLKLTSRQSVDAVKSYREANDPVVAIWGKYEDAAIAAVETGKTIKAGKCKFFTKRGFLWIELPSGRRLAYLRPEITYRAVTYVSLEVDPKTGKDIEVQKTGRAKKTIVFQGLDKSKKKMHSEITHGGVLTENIVQATARDLMMYKLPKSEKVGYKIKLLVHDEVIAQRKKGEGSVEEFTGILCESLGWDEGLPLDAKGWLGPRYRK